MTVVAIINHKGGVGKTTTTVNLGAALQEMGKRVLLVDLDPQASLTIHLGHKRPETLPANCGHVLKAALSGSRLPTLRDVLTQSPAGLDLIPAGRQLADAETLLGQGFDWASILRNCLAPLRQDYDYTLIDCLPSRNYLAYNALAAADAIVVPMQTDYLAAQGLALTFQSAVNIQQRHNPHLTVLGILLTMVDTRTNHSRYVMAAVKRSFAGKVRVFETVIRFQVGFKESSKAGMSMLRYSPGSIGAMAYRSLAGEVIAAAEEMGAAGARSDGTADEPGSAVLSEATMVALAQAEQLAHMAGVVGTRVQTRTRATPDVWPFGDDVRDRIGQGRSVGPTQEGPRLEGPRTTCPHLGLADEQTKQLAEPDENHRCWADGTPFAVDQTSQSHVCLRDSYWSCPRYIRRNTAMETRKPSVFARLISWLRG